MAGPPIATVPASIIKNSSGNLILRGKGDGVNPTVTTGDSLYTGTTTVNAGTLTLDYSVQNNSKIAPLTQTHPGSATLSLINPGTFTQNVASLVLTANTASHITFNAVGTGTVGFAMPALLPPLRQQSPIDH